MLNTERQEQAIAWVIRLRHASEQDWEAFTAWLESDPANVVAYEEAALADLDAQTLLPNEPVAPAVAPAAEPVFPAERRHSRRSILGWSIAASLLAVTTYGFVSRSGTQTIETAPGELRQVALGDGSRVELNGGSRLILDPDRPRFAQLERGEALFRIIHDPARPFEVEAGDALLRDMGTVFNVVRDEETLEVAVAEGAVLYNPGREARSLKPGMALRKGSATGLSIGRVDLQAVGSWNEGRLVYSAAPVARVAADLSRNLGMRIAASGELKDRPFSGIIILDGERRQTLNRAASLVGAKLSKDGDGWILESGARATG